VIVPDDQLSLAIGKDGLNARLAARLTGWRVDIRSETEFAEEETSMGYEEEEVSGRCAAILSNGKRCPNASVPGSRYCGLPAHQALANQEGDHLPGGEPDPVEANGAGDDEPAVAEPEAVESEVAEPEAAEPVAAEPEAAPEGEPVADQAEDAT
jgi:N utilization substance protein A